MQHPVYAMSVEAFIPMLATLSELLDKGAEHARSKGRDPDTLVDERLAPDMFPLSAQIMLSCHHARDATARLTGSTPPQMPPSDKAYTLAALKGEIEKTIHHLKSLSAKSFDEAAERKIEMPLFGNFHFHSTGFQLLRDWSLPHFYFHAVTAYDILRHQGVPLGKRDYLSQIGKYIREKK